MNNSILHGRLFVYRFLASVALVAIVVLIFFMQSTQASEAEVMNTPAQQLVRIDVSSQEQLEAIDRTGVEILDLISGVDGSIVLYALTSQEIQTQLEQVLIPWWVVDAYPVDKHYYAVYDLMLEGEQPDLDRLTLDRTRQYRLVALPPETEFQIQHQGHTIRRLIPHRLILPKDSALGLQKSLEQPDPKIQAMINTIRQEDVYDLVAGLSGERAVQVNGNNYTILTRYSRSGTPIARATLYVHEQLSSYGLQTDFDYYRLADGTEWRNVVGEQRGTVQPGNVVLLIAHLDSLSEIPYVRAPGADDNASGSAGVLAVAKALSQYDFGCTIRYILFTGEEQGYYGSTAYASEVYQRGEDFVGVLNLDMIGYNSDSNPVVELHTRPRWMYPGDGEIADLFKDVISMYRLPLTVEVVQDSLSWSDHLPFWNYGYSAVLAMEDFQDFTPYYHSSNDRLVSLDLDYLTTYARAAAATIAHMGCSIDLELTNHIFMPAVDRNRLVHTSLPAQPVPTVTSTPPPTPAASETATSVPGAPPVPSATEESCPNSTENGGFEADTAWEIPSTSYPAEYSNENFHSGLRSMRIGIFNPAENQESYSSVRQQVSLPQDLSSAMLTFWLYPMSSDVQAVGNEKPVTRGDLNLESPAMDAQYVLVLDENDQQIGMLLWQTKNDQSWVRHQFDLSSFSGRTIKLHFGVSNDGSEGVSGLYVDDVSLPVCLSP